MNLQQFFDQNKKIAVAFSGGVDSAYLLYAAKNAGCDVTAYYAKSEFQPRFEYDDALRLAASLDVKLVTIELSAFADKRITANDSSRCYYCKKLMLGEIIRSANADGYDIIVDGTNASDCEDERPGMKAGAELGIRSPLAMANLSKDEIRKLSKEAGLFTWNKPSYACLATRVRTGDPIVMEDLQITEALEEEIKKIGFVDFRVRMRKEDGKRNAFFEIRDRGIDSNKVQGMIQQAVNVIDQYYSEDE